MCRPEDTKECKVVIVKRGNMDCCESDIHAIHGHSAMMRQPEAQCCCGPTVQRRFVSSTEKIEHLEKYKSELEKELEGVTEAIEKFKAD
ncbi:MAG: hypothetical protein NTY09_04900 [bacterium]|nr:hypothetical protein [bacterium]